MVVKSQHFMETVSCKHYAKYQGGKHEKNKTVYTYRYFRL